MAILIYLILLISTISITIYWGVLKNQVVSKGWKRFKHILPNRQKMLSEILQVLGYEVVVERTADRSRS